MNSKLTSAAFAATLVVFSTATATAQEADAQESRGDVASEKPQDQKKQGSTKEKDSSAASSTKKGAKGSASRSGATSEGAPADQTDRSKGALEEADEGAARGAAKANEDIVGKDAQQTNEQRARAPRTDREETKEGETPEAAQKIGHATTTAAASVVEAGEDVTRATDKPGRYNPVAVTWNPLGLMVGGRISFNLEWAPVTHHVVIVSPHFANTSQDVTVSPDVTRSNTFSGVGGEIGYRYYTGRKGMNGVFVGPSLVGGVYNADLISGEKAFTNIGIAADVGVQQIFFDHLALGAGVGIMYLNVSRDFGDLPAGPSTIAEQGVKPRFLAQAGYAF